MEKVSSKIMFLCEGETDTMRLHQELEGKAAVFGLSGVNAWRADYVEAFKDAKVVFVILDNDQDYKVQEVVTEVWRKIRLDLGPRARRVELPMGVKDVCEFFDTYDLETLRELTKRTTASRRFAGLDLTKPAPPVNWLVQDLLASGDASLLIGDPGLGKSWMTMDLACAVADPRREKWLGRPVHKHGAVMYVDEENPEDLIFQRFAKLGLSRAAAKNIHYLYRPGVWMNKEPDAFLDEALSIQPELIVLDSLSRIHSEDENNANAMASLFRDAIQPLARETGAAVVVIHHTIKSEDANSYRRARGSGDITAVVDNVLDARVTDLPGKFYVIQGKSRRRAGGESISVQITDRADGSVELVANGPDDFNF